MPNAFALDKGILQPDQFLKIAAQKLMMGEYPNGRSWQERFVGSGGTIYSEGTTEITGQVYGQGRFLCFSYPAESGSVGGCFEIWRRSANCFDFYGTGTGTGDANAITVASNREKVLGISWSARGWQADQKSTCVSDQIS